MQSAGRRNNRAAKRFFIFIIKLFQRQVLKVGIFKTVIKILPEKEIFKKLR
jgi:hypothetical protein